MRPLGKGRQALLRRLWASHRLRQEVEETLGEIKSEPPKTWSHLHLTMGIDPSAPVSVSARPDENDDDETMSLFDVEADDFVAELDQLGAGGGGITAGHKHVIFPPPDVAAMLRDSCALRKHAEAVLRGGDDDGNGKRDGTTTTTTTTTSSTRFDEDAACRAGDRVNAAAAARNNTKTMTMMSKGAAANLIMSVVVKRARATTGDEYGDDDDAPAAGGGGGSGATVRERIGVGRMLIRGQNLRAEGRRLGL